MLKLGSAILSLWVLMNLVPSLLILFNILFAGGTTPALYAIVTENEVKNLNPNILVTINSIAVFANGLNAGLCSASIFLIWLGINRRIPWAFWATLVGLAFALFAGTAADYVIGIVFPEINIISALILALGFTLSAVGIFRKKD